MVPSHALEPVVDEPPLSLPLLEPPVVVPPPPLELEEPDELPLSLPGNPVVPDGRPVVPLESTPMVEEVVDELEPLVSV